MPRRRDQGLPPLAISRKVIHSELHEAHRTETLECGHVVVTADCHKRLRRRCVECASGWVSPEVKRRLRIEYLSANVAPNLSDRDCWEWVQPKDRNGYGFASFESRCFRAHRFSYETYVGPIPHGMVVCHKCDNPACVNPDHLFIGTHADNHRDMCSKGRNIMQTHPERAHMGHCGELNPASRLADHQRKTIGSQWLSGTTRRQLAEEYQVSRGTIERIIGVMLKNNKDLDTRNTRQRTVSR